MFKATFNTVTNVVIGVKQKWYKKAEPVELQQRGQFTIGGLTEEESKEIQSPFCLRLVGIFTNTTVESIKIEEEVQG